MRPNELDCYYIELDFQSNQTLGINIHKDSYKVITAYVYQSGQSTPEDVVSYYLKAQAAISLF